MHNVTVSEPDEFGNSTGSSTAATAQLDYGVILYSCSFAVIFLMILCQVRYRALSQKKRLSGASRGEPNLTII